MRIKREILILPVLFGCLLLTSCNDDITAVNPEGDARYRITFQGIWMEPDHGALPGNAHFTTLIGMTHDASQKLFSVGGFATAGVEDVAETGSVNLASEEIDQYIAGGQAFSKLVVGVSTGGQGSGNGEFTVSEDRPLLSVISMIAPSPDWFIGLRDFPLIENGIWVEDMTMQVGMYDAGTEDGDQFSGDNPDTSPVQAIAPLTELNASSLANGSPGIAPIGTLRLEKLE